MKLVVPQKSSQPTLRIYTDDGAADDGLLPEGKMSEEMRKMRKELEATKAALKAQAARCRQLVAAFARKLQEKESELRKSSQLRDQQLSCVLRSLLVLEARLRKEQKLIRHQLAEKDEVIARQNRELAELKRSEHNIEQAEDSVDSQKFENAYKDNPVLESVNQILLKDEEDLLTEVKPVVQSEKNGKLDEGVEWYETGSSLIVPDDQQSSSGAWCIQVIEEDDPVPPVGADRLWVREKTSPPTKAQHSEEKTCLQMAKKTLTVAIHKDLEEVDSNNCAVSECSYQELAPVVSTKPIYQKLPTPQKPPALPPKPSRLLKPSELLQQRVDTIKPTTGKPDTHPKPRVHVQEIKRKQMNGHVPGNLKPQAPFIVVPTTERIQPPLPAVRLKNVPEKKEAGEFLKSTGVRNNLRHDAPEAAIRMGSSVSSLITGAARDSIVTELTSPPEASVTQLVRQFETRNQSSKEDPLQENFEEFKLDESYVESVNEGDGRPEADGAEARCAVSHYAVLAPLPPPPVVSMPPPTVTVDSTRTYETFLETTGLSQKSILTPSRMLSNHRSCLKPKDVKHRSRVKAAAIEKCLGPTLGPTVKYWTEPYL